MRRNFLALLLLILATASAGAGGLHADAQLSRSIENTSRLAAIALGYIGRGNFAGHQGPWCRDAVNSWLRQAGLYTDGRRDAGSVGRLGAQTRPAVGAIAYSARHTGVVVKVVGSKVWLVSGNWSRKVKLHVSLARYWRYIMPRRG